MIATKRNKSCVDVSILVIDCKLEEKLIEVPPGNDCICPRDTVTYECTVIGNYGGFSLWIGDFFRCSSGKQIIELLHSHDGTVTFNDQTCNNGEVVGRIVRVENGSFISQLNVTLTNNTAGRTIECANDNGTSIRRIGLLNLPIGSVCSILCMH